MSSSEPLNDLSAIVIDETLSIKSKQEERSLLAKLFQTNSNCIYATPVYYRGVLHVN